MVVTYLAQATLITLYLRVLLVFRFDRVPKSFRILKILLAVQHSTPAFLNVSFVFSMAMLLAALVSFARNVAEDGVLNLTAWHC